MRILTLLFFNLFFITLSSQVESFKQFQEIADQFFQEVVEGSLVDYELVITSNSREALINFIEKADPSELSGDARKAFRINSYNLSVINLIADSYPINSVQDVGGFFEKSTLRIESKQQSLNNYEKKYLLSEFNDPRLHFVLVCGAKGCPPIVNFAYNEENLEQQLAEQTRRALNDPNFLMLDDKSLVLSQIFKWYADDFGENKEEIVNFIDSYRSEEIAKSLQLSYYDYDWSLNSSNQAVQLTNGASANRYVVSAAIPKGAFEFKVFNNLYTQSVGDASSGSRSTFFTAAISSLYGVNNIFNVGIAGRVRSVRNADLPSSPLDAFRLERNGEARYGITALGPQIRYAPFKKLQNFSIQSSFTFPLGKDLSGNNDKPYIDWNGAVFNTQFFNDMTLSSRFSLFTEIDLLIEDIGFKLENHAFRISTPVTLIASYFPTQKSTIYLLSGFSPYWQTDFDYFYQFGLGTKYQLRSDFELELLFSKFSNKYLLENDGQAYTFNLGIRYSVF